MNRIIEFIKKETVLSIAMILALISMAAVHPDREYLAYIDFKTLCILFSLMAVMEGFKSIGVFRLTAEKLLRKASGIRSIMMILVCLCFFFSMLITNDVALITFVPFTIIIFGMLGKEISRKLLIPTVVMQTIAANLGSMLTPLGNPQNLYLYGISGISLGNFLLLMLPFTALSFALLIIRIVLMTRSCGSKCGINIPDGNIHIKKENFAVYLILFALCLLTVAKIIHFAVTAAIVLAVFLVIDRSILKRLDYSLLLTFCGFFIFIGNMGRIGAVNDFLRSIIDSNEFATAVISSQIISNVPAALLLSGFTDNCKQLILGTNIGGLGTLIASMASLISFKYIAKEDSSLRGKYFMSFTAANIFFLVCMIVMYVVLYNF